VLRVSGALLIACNEQTVQALFIIERLTVLGGASNWMAENNVDFPG